MMSRESRGLAGFHSRLAAKYRSRRRCPEGRPRGHPREPWDRQGTPSSPVGAACRALIILFLGLLASAPGALAVAQQPAASPAPPEPVVAIVGGEVWTVTKGIVRDGRVILRGAKIEKVGGAEVEIPTGATVIDARGKVVTPGFVTAMAGGGLSAAGAGRIKDALDPFAIAVSLALATGVTSAYVTGGGPARTPGGDGAPTLGTSNAVVKMTEGDPVAMLLKEPVMSTLAADGLGLSARWNLRDQFRRAREYQAKFEQYEQEKKAGKMVTEPRKPADADPVLPLIRCERRLRVTASRVTDIRWALGLVDDFGIQVAITPATEAWLIPEEIARRDVPLIILPRDRTPADERRNAASGTNPQAPGILRRAGVRFAVLPPGTGLSTGGMIGRDLLTYPLEAAFAMRGGLDEQSALEAVTILPARILGVDDRVGSLEPGKDADVLILDGDPLDYRTLVEKTFVNGKLLYDREKSPYFNHVRRERAAAAAGR